MQRNRAWRRFQARKRRSSSHVEFNQYENLRREKNWKHIYLRSNKVKRAQQLGFDYPRKTLRQLLDLELYDDQTTFYL